MADEIAELRHQLELLEGRMNTKYAEYTTDIARLAEDIAKRDAERNTEAAKRDAEAAKREVRLIVTIAVFLVGAGAILGVLIRLPPAV